MDSGIGAAGFSEEMVCAVGARGTSAEGLASTA
jgi:hypothetical protein